MSEYLGSAVLELRANAAPLRAGLMSAEAMTRASVDRMHTETGRRMMAFGNSMGSIGRNMSHAMTVPILGVGVASAKMSMDFQAAMTTIQTQAGASAKEVATLHDKVLALSGKVAQSPKALADALYHLESIGLRGKKAMDALRIASMGAAVGHANLEQTATALGAAWLVNIKGAHDLNGVMGLLNATVGVGNMRMQDLVTSLGTGVLPQAKRAGLGIKDVMGALAVFSDEGYRAYSAATQMATAFHYLTDPTKKATDALSTIGMSQFQLAGDMHKPNGLLVALKDLRDHLDQTYPPGRKLTIDQETAALARYRDGLVAGGVSSKKLAADLEAYKLKLKSFGTAAISQEAVLGDIFPAGRGRVMGVLMNQLTRYQMKLEQITKGEGKWGSAQAATQATAAFKAKAAWDGLQASMVKFGDKVLPTLVTAGQKVLGVINSAFTGFQSLPKGLQDKILTGGLILAGIGPAMMVLGAFSRVLGRAWEVASGFAKLAMGQGFRQVFGQKGQLVRFAEGTGMGGKAFNSMVATMEVGELIVKGGIAGGGFGGGSGGRGSGGSPVMSPSGPNRPPPMIYDPASGRYIPFEGPLPPVTGRVQGASTPYGAPFISHDQARLNRAGAFASQQDAFYAHYPQGQYGAPTGGTLMPPEGKGVMSTIGGGLMRGLGVLGVAAFAGPMAYGLFQGVKAWIHNDALSQGREWATKFTAGLPGHISDAMRAGLAKTAADASTRHYLDQISGLHPTRGGTAVGPQSPQAAAAAAKAAWNQGWTGGNVGAAALNSIQTPTPMLVLDDIIGRMKMLPVQSRAEGAKVMLQMATSMEANGKLPKHSVQMMIDSINALWPGMVNDFKKVGVTNDKNLAQSMHLTQATKVLKNTLLDYRTQFGDWAMTTKITSKNIDQTMTSAMTHLRYIISTTTGAARQRAEIELKRIQGAFDTTKQAAHGLGLSFAQLEADTKQHLAGVGQAWINLANQIQSTAPMFQQMIGLATALSNAFNKPGTPGTLSPNFPTVKHRGGGGGGSSPVAPIGTPSSSSSSGTPLRLVPGTGGSTGVPPQFEHVSPQEYARQVYAYDQQKAANAPPKAPKAPPAFHESKAEMALIDQAAGISAGVTAGQSQLTDRMSRRGIDPAGAQGAAMLSRWDNYAAHRLQKAVNDLRKAFAMAKATHNRQDILSVGSKLQAALAALDTAVTDRVVAHRTAVEALAQAVTDKAAHRTTMAQTGFAAFQLREQLMGGTTGGPADAAYIQKHIIPALRGDMSALKNQERRAIKVGDKGLARTIQEQIAQKGNDILQAQLDVQTDIKGNTAQTTSALLALANQQIATMGQQNAMLSAQSGVLGAGPAMPGLNANPMAGVPVALSVLPYTSSPAPVAGAASAGFGSGVAPGTPVTVVHVVVEDGAVDKKKIKVITKKEIHAYTHHASRKAGRRLPSAGGGRFA